MTILRDIQQLNAGNLITLHELDVSQCIGKYGQISTDVFRWCDGVNEIGNDVVWNGVSYLRYPIQATGFDKLGNGQIPRPKLVVANIGGIIGSLTRDYNDLVGAKLTRTRTFARYLDTINFKRFNYLLYSNNLMGSAWSEYKTGSAAGTIQILSDDTYGTVLRVTKTAGTTTDRLGIKQIISGLTGSQYNAFSYIRKRTSTSSGYAIYVEADRISGGLSTSSAEITSANTVVDEWKQLSTVSNSYELSGSATVYLWVDGPVGSSIEFTWPQVSIGSTINEYQETGANWNPYADPTQYLDKEIWTIDRKSNENSAYVEWELTAPFDLIGVKIPRRQCVQNMCNWKYRGAECGYTGTQYFNVKDIAVVSPSLDICGKRVASCKLRFGSTAILPYGGFPAVGI